MSLILASEWTLAVYLTNASRMRLKNEWWTSEYNFGIKVRFGFLPWVVTSGGKATVWQKHKFSANSKEDV